MKHFLLSILLLLAASPGWARPTMEGPSYLGSAQTVTWRFDTTTEASPLFGAKGLCVATFIRAGSETVTLYQTTASTATGGTSIATFSATTTSPTSLTIGQPNLYAVSDGATAGGSLTVHCSPLQVSDTGGVVGSGPLVDMLAYVSPRAGDMWQLTDAGNQSCALDGGIDTAFLCQWDAIAEGWVPVDTLSGSVTGLTNPLVADLEAGTFDANANMGTGGASINWPQFSVTNPATYTIGGGVTWGSDQVAKNRPGGTEIDTRNHLMGWYANKTGVNGSVVTNCEPAWDWSHETNFRTTAATADDSWPELNFDLFPPKFTIVPTGVTGTFSAGDYIEFSGGGFGKVTSYTGGTLTYVHTTSPCTANAETITNRTQAGGGTVASLTSVGQVAQKFRPMQFEWDVPDGELRWSFSTRQADDTGPSALRINNERVGVNAKDNLDRRFTVWNDEALFAAALIEYDGSATSGQNGNAGVLELKSDWGNNANTHFESYDLKIIQPVGGASASITYRRPILIEDQRGWGSFVSATEYTASQTCNGSACGTGDKNNIFHAGYNWNTGHFTVGTTSSAGDHLWRDQTNEKWRTQTDATPTSETSGRALAEMYDENNTAALGTSEIASEACATVVTVAATGVATTDVISWGFNGDVTAVTGYAPVTTGALSIYAYPTANNVNFKVCNPTAAPITPGAVTLNFNVVR